jgi:acyl-CoA dehydrogenase
MYEAVTHAAGRRLYGTRVTDFPHIRRLLVDAYVRLVAMRLFATRAIDYMRSATLEDRRYLLYNPLVKMKVTTQGEEVVNLLWDVIAARGFEKDTYFEMAARDIRALPKLEGTVHVNMALVIKFMAAFMLQPANMPDVPARLDPTHDAFLFAQGPARGLRSVRFHDLQLAYGPVDLPNAQVFKEQIVGLRRLLLETPPSKEQSRDMDLLLSLGEIFSLVVYGQLILEAARLQPVPEPVLDQILHVMVRDLSRCALDLHAAAGVTDAQARLCQEMIRRPVHDPDQCDAVFSGHVAVLEGAYAMAP